MESIHQIKQKIIRQRRRLEGDRQAVRFCKSCVKEEAHELLTRPAAFVASFGAGWWLARWSRRPKQIRQAKNVTIKRASFSNQVLRTLAPFVLAEIRRPAAEPHVGEMVGEHPNPSIGHPDGPG